MQSPLSEIEERGKGSCMSYVRVNWNDLPSSDANATPVSAANLNHMDRGIRNTHAEAMSVSQRDALSGADLFNGRIIFNTTAERLEIFLLPDGKWLRMPIRFDSLNRFDDQVIEGIKTFNQKIVGETAFLGMRAWVLATRNISSTNTRLNWDVRQSIVDPSEFQYQTGGFAPPGSTFVDRFIVPATGFYEMICQLELSPSSAGPFEVRLFKTGAVELAGIRSHPDQQFGSSHMALVMDTEFLKKDEYVWVIVRVASLNPAEIIRGPTRSYFSMFRVGA
jgi:hypothetical protein